MGLPGRNASKNREKRKKYLASLLSTLHFPQGFLWLNHSEAAHSLGLPNLTCRNQFPMVPYAVGGEPGVDLCKQALTQCPGLDRMNQGWWLWKKQEYILEPLISLSPSLCLKKDLFGRLCGCLANHSRGRFSISGSCYCPCVSDESYRWKMKKQSLKTERALCTVPYCPWAPMSLSPGVNQSWHHNAHILLNMSAPN